MLRKTTLAVVTLTLALYATAHARPPSNSRTPTPSAVTTPSQNAVTCKATLDYYNRAGDLLQQELPALKQADRNGNWSDKAAICRRAASNLRALPRQQVDPEVVDFVADLAAWLSDCAACCDDAANLSDFGQGFLEGFVGGLIDGFLFDGTPIATDLVIRNRMDRARRLEEAFARLRSRLSDLERRRHELESRLERRYELRLK
jgi:hypothetical protein